MAHLFIFVLYLLYFRARLFIDALWSPAGKGLTFWLSFVMFNCELVNKLPTNLYCELVTFPWVSWLKYGA